MTRQMYIVMTLLLSAFLLHGCAERGSTANENHSNHSNHPSSETAQPYAGWEKRAIKAISPERVEGLLEGRGLQYALAAELNSYPGPLHVLVMKTELNITEEQEEQVEDIMNRMKVRAVELGNEIVKLEKNLNDSFAGGLLDDQTLHHIVSAIADKEAELRYTHLAAHLKVKELMTLEQIAEYDRLRGYDQNAQGEHHNHQDR